MQESPSTVALNVLFLVRIAEQNIGIYVQHIGRLLALL